MFVSITRETISPSIAVKKRWHIQFSVLARESALYPSAVFSNLMHLSEQFLPCFRFSFVHLPFIKTAFTDRKSRAHHPYWKFLFFGTVLNVHKHTVLFYFFRSCTKKPSASFIKPVLETLVSETGYLEMRCSQSYYLCDWELVDQFGYEGTELVLYLICIFKLSYFFFEPAVLSLNISICIFSFFVFLYPLLSPACQCSLKCNSWENINSRRLLHSCAERAYIIRDVCRTANSQCFSAALFQRLKINLP